MTKDKHFFTISDEIKGEYKPSAYNVCLSKDGRLIYNTVSQAVAMFEKTDLSEYVDDMVENGFLVKSDTDELSDLKKEYDSRESFSKELHLIIALTLDCNFRCFYCYEKHPKRYMHDDVKLAIVNLVKKNAMLGKNISITWYGGEPMLDFDSIKELTSKFKKICETYNVNYCASMISNGYLFNDESIREIDNLCIKDIQITLDGIKEVHEKRRPMIGGTSSFHQIVENIIRINNETSAVVKLRINVDKSNIDRAHQLIEYCSNLGLHNIDLTLGLMKAFGCDHSCGNANDELFSMFEFSQEYLKFREHAKKLGFERAVNKMTPKYKINSCTMDAPNSYVVDPEGFVYKCISQVGQPSNSIGNVKLEFDSNAHKRISPFANKLCSKCVYFPICKGGCLLNNSKQNAECNIWKFVTKSIILSDIG